MLRPHGPLPHEDRVRASASRGVRLHGELRECPRRDPSVSEARRVSEAPIGVGSAFDLIARFGGRDVPLRYEIVEYDDTATGVVLEARRPGIRLEGHRHGRARRERVGRALPRNACVRWDRSDVRSRNATHLQSGRGSRDARDADGAEPVTPSPAANLVDWTPEARVGGSFTRIGYHIRQCLSEWTPLHSQPSRRPRALHARSRGPRRRRR